MLLFACVSLVFWSRTPHRGRDRGRRATAEGARSAREKQRVRAGAAPRARRHAGGTRATGGAAHYAGSLLCMLPTRYNAKDTRLKSLYI